MHHNRQSARTAARRLVSDRKDVRGPENVNEENIPVSCNSCAHASVDADPLYTINGLSAVPGDAYIARLAVCKGCGQRRYRKPTDGRAYTYNTKLRASPGKQNMLPSIGGDMSSQMASSSKEMPNKAGFATMKTPSKPESSAVKHPRGLATPSAAQVSAPASIRTSESVEAVRRDGSSYPIDYRPDEDKRAKEVEEALQPSKLGSNTRTRSRPGGEEAARALEDGARKIKDFVEKALEGYMST
ncbi:hypothetical protein KC343_g2370 [Hortaea werneckii]|nr:hypothetical protein KC323_g9005 [Hortaea werneckii]KAI7290903.1 hypothetical protein KC352_g2978 [Hortaea werneckii]KAI7345229.1 hypothetical protein KC320_g8418 [Hortaea werneckii]KAI7572802.1 hypothetical protein KC317_g438 [Hortaea werneckii]KAI7628086.1 hypothetical protein KC346_g402 [Hortaea werneckii]